MVVGTLAGIWRYPVKSLRGEPLERAGVDAEGIPGDRASALFVRRGHAREGKTFRGKEHAGLHRFSDAAAAAAALGGVDLEVRSGHRYFDDAPISLLIDRWLDDLDAHVGYAVEPQRFRPNFFVRAAREFTTQESQLRGVALRLGGVGLRVRGPIERCVTVTYHPQEEPADAEILRFLAGRRNAWMGVYCDVVAPGVLSIGDALSLEDGN